MTTLKYTGTSDYRDPRKRFVAKKGDLVAFVDAEANELVKEPHWSRNIMVPKSTVKKTTVKKG